MQIPSAARTAGIALLLGAALVLGSGVAFADDADEKTEESTSTTTGKMHVVVQDSDGKRTVKVLQMKDGEWVAVEDDEKAEGGAKVPVENVLELITPRIRMRRGGAPGTVMLARPGEPASKGAAAPHPRRNPIATALRWLFQRQGQDVEGKPFDAWFDGDDVPLEGLRDALKADGWTANTLRDWMQEHLGGGPRLKNRYAGMPRAGAQGFRGMRRSMPWDSTRGHGMWGQPRTYTQSKAYMLWNDGSGWQTREIPVPHGAMMPYGMTPYGMAPYGQMPYPMPWAGGYGMPWGYGPWMRGQAECCPNGRCPHCGNRLQTQAAPWQRFFQREADEEEEEDTGGEGAEAGAWIQALPPEIRKALRGELGSTPWKLLEGAPGSVRSQLFQPPSRSCETCPNKGRCQGKCQGNCQGKCGEGCTGSCEDCPNKGTCKEKGKAGCCGTCK